MEEELIEEVYEAPSALESFFNYILPQLPPIGMCLITLALVFVFLCAWKAPRWIKPVGSIALSVTLISITWPYLATFCQDIKANYGAFTLWAVGIHSFTYCLSYSEIP